MYFKDRYFEKVLIYMTVRPLSIDNGIILNWCWFKIVKIYKQGTSKYWIFFIFLINIYYCWLRIVEGYKQGAQGPKNKMSLLSNY